MKQKITKSNLKVEEEKKLHALMEEVGAFHAFAKDFDQKKKEGVQYVNFIGGLVIPKDQVDAFRKKFNKIHKETAEQYEVISDLDGHIITILNTQDSSGHINQDKILSLVQINIPAAPKKILCGY